MVMMTLPFTTFSQTETVKKFNNVTLFDKITGEIVQTTPLETILTVIEFENYSLLKVISSGNEIHETFYVDKAYTNSNLFVFETTCIAHEAYMKITFDRDVTEMMLHDFDNYYYFFTTY